MAGNFPFNWNYDQRDGTGSQHYWRIFFDEKLKNRIEALAKGKAITVKTKPQEEPDEPFTKMTEWGGMYFRSPHEIKIAEELDQRGILFFANAKGRVGTEGCPISEQETPGRLEIDFLIFYGGHCISLEVDGRQHQEQGQSDRDYTRDRLLQKEGIPTVRFKAEDCLKKAKQCVDELIQIIKNCQ